MTETTTNNQTTNDADLAALGLAGQDLTAGDFVGTPLKYSRGKWTKTVLQGGKKVAAEIGATAVFVVDPLSYAFGWLKWKDKRLVMKIGPGRPIDGFVLPLREELPDRDKSRWPWRNGKQEDPWQEIHQLTMKDADTGELLTWMTNTWGGKKAIGALLRSFAGKAKKHPGQYPRVLLGSRTDPHPDFGTLEKPTINIVDWAAFGDGAAPPGSPMLAPAILLPRQQPTLALAGPAEAESSLDDEIPF